MDLNGLPDGSRLCGSAEHNGIQSCLENDTLHPERQKNGQAGSSFRIQETVRAALRGQHSQA